MDDTDIKRKLATILVADVVGYSRLTANDEDWTIRALGDFRKIVDDIVERHDGRIFNTGGDSVLAEFASPVEAVRAAVDFQEAARSRNLLQPRDRQLRYRIGINLGDVMVRGTDLLGDGVNVAARLEGLAEPGGICVSGTVWDHINDKLSIGYVDIGEQAVKNIPRPVRAYHLRVDGGHGEVAEAAQAPRRAARAARKPPIAAVLGGAAAIILVLAGVLAWQLWPKANAPPVAAAVPPKPTPAALPLREALSARLAAVLPALAEKTREDETRNYENDAAHKAFAASLETGGIWQVWDRPTGQDARDAALEGCQIFFGRACVLVAEDETLPPIPPDGKLSIHDMPRAHYSGDFDPEKIPAVLPLTRLRADIANYRSTAAPKAAAFRPMRNGLFISTNAANQRSAEELALKACNDDTARNALTGPCFLYAVDNRVVLPLRLTGPLTAPVAASPIPAAPTAAVAQPAPAPQPAPAQSASGTAPPKTFRDCPNCPEMVVVPAGRFQMGAAPGENERFKVPSTDAAHAEPQHQVTFAKPFALGTFDVTRGEFASFASAAGFKPRPSCFALVDGNWQQLPQGSWQEPGFAQTDRDPVVCMNIFESGAYLGWLKHTTGKDYRLPSEAEWEYAARGGTTTAFYWGDDPKDACVYENVGDQSLGDKYGVTGVIPCRDGFADIAPVGSFKPNPFGLYDMLGNIFVLTADCWNDSYAGAPSDGSARTAGDCTKVVTRKAAFGNPRAWMFRADNREFNGDIVKRNRVGFRVALSLP